MNWLHTHLRRPVGPYLTPSAGWATSLLAHTNALMILVMLLIGLANVVYAEKIPVNNGFGFDGRIYGNLAQRFPVLARPNGDAPHQAQRWLPSALVHYALPLLGLKLSAPNIIRAFDLLNVFWLTVAAFAWGRVADDLQIGARGRWIGFAAIFLNFSVLKHAAYYPVLTDATGFGLAWLLFLAYLKRKPVVVWIITVAGVFAWPTVLYCGLILWLFPRRTFLARPMGYPWHTLGAICAALVVAGWVAFNYYVRQHVHSGAPDIASAVNLSLCGVVAYIFLSTRPVLRAGLGVTLRSFLSWRWLLRLAVALATLAASRAIVSWMPLSNAGAPEQRWLIGFASLSIAKPLIFWLAHILFFGPIILVAAFVWKAASEHIIQEGLGLSLVVLMGLVMGIASESRILLGFIPFLVPFIVLALEERRLPRGFLAWFYALSFLFSKVWVSVNTGPLVTIPREAHLEFPWQSLFSSVGWWMSNDAYLVQGILVLVIALFLYVQFFKQPAQASEAAPTPVV